MDQPKGGDLQQAASGTHNGDPKYKIKQLINQYEKGMFHFEEPGQNLVIRL